MLGCKGLSLHLKTLCLTIQMKATERGTAHYTVGTAWHQQPRKCGLSNGRFIVEFERCCDTAIQV